MQRLLHDELWEALGARARKAASRRAAIAYVTVDYLGLGDGDQLIVDASELAIRSGETNAKLLLQLHRKGVEIYSRRGLHAKILLLDDLAFVGSANMSKSSAKRLDEAGVLTDHAGTVAAVQTLLRRWTAHRKPLTESSLVKLSKLPVAPRRGPAMIGGSRAAKAGPQGGRVWVVGVSELREDAFPKEQARLEKGIEKAESQRSNPHGDLSWIRWTGGNGFGAQCRQGDIVFQVQRSLQKKRLFALRPMTVVLVDQEPTCRRVHLENYPGRMVEEMTLLQFRKLLSNLGVSRPVGGGSSRILTDDVGEELVRAWKRWGG